MSPVYPVRWWERNKVERTDPSRSAQDLLRMVERGDDLKEKGERIPLWEKAREGILFEKRGIIEDLLDSSVNYGERSQI